MQRPLYLSFNVDQEKINCAFIVAAMYGVLFIICTFVLIYKRNKEMKEEAERDEMRKVDNSSE